ncbi:hypothetical protein [Aquimarina sediminis]|uniref:hypothetical protein n=1 Tax=Aquimarina sediminis TaxID=2070536 RepID=UPI000CA0166A|nr:hypothetical protein [Aquimarina sediminis]
MKSLKNKIALLTVSIGIFYFVSCSKDHNIPQANLNYLKFKPIDKKHPILDIYNVNFSSDIAIDSLLKEIGGDPYLFCSLSNENIDFGIEATGINNPHLSGSFEKVKSSPKIEKLHYYTAEVIFYNADHSSEEYLSKEFLKNHISKIECINCKVVNRFFMDTRKPYISNSMCIPVEDILKALDD